MFPASPAAADVIVLANRTTSSVQVQVKPVTAPAVDLTLAAGDVVPIFADGRAHASFVSRGQGKRYALDANAAYFFGRSDDGRLDLVKIGMNEDESTAAGRTLPGRAATTPSAVIPVKILVDEDEPARQPVWERRLRARVDAASAVLERHARVQLKVVALAAWNSDNATNDFFASLGEFEREVKPFPGQLAIGFTSQYRVVRGRVHLAGTRGALHTHILVREWGQHMSEPERLELLVHELGHFLGAAHSPEPDSVMRPVLGNRQAVRAGFRVRFDPVNTLAMSLVGEELRRRRIQRITELTPGTNLRLRQIYQSLSPTLPRDPAADHLTRSVEVATVKPLLQGTKQVLAQIVASAQANLGRPVAASAQPGEEIRREGDELTELCVRRGAGIARFLPDDVAASSFLLGLGIAMDDSDTLRDHPQFGAFVRSIESDYDRSLRRVFLSGATIHGRRDLTRHFAVSAYLTAAGGSRAAQSASVAAQLRETDAGAGFSFAAIAAHRAGVLFAGGAINKKFSLAALSRGFTVLAYVPLLEELPEGLAAAELESRFGGRTDARFLRQLQVIDDRLLRLPPYRGAEIARER